MANVTIVIPDILLTYYATARASWNAYVLPLGGTPLPAPTAGALQTLVKNIMKQRVRAEAIRSGALTDEQIDALFAALDAL